MPTIDPPATAPGCLGDDRCSWAEMGGIGEGPIEVCNTCGALSLPPGAEGPVEWPVEAAANYETEDAAKRSETEGT